jgi:NhaP-type Na+/H+ or K+/H+ antiporter
VYALLSLTVIRMVPVAVALTGAHLGWPTVSFVGWFGPRGLASVVFALLALEELGKTALPLVSVIAITVLMSVIAHGVTAEPLADRYAARLAREAAGPAHAESPELPVRNLTRHRHAAAPGPGPRPGPGPGPGPGPDS